MIQTMKNPTKATSKLVPHKIFLMGNLDVRKHFSQNFMWILSKKFQKIFLVIFQQFSHGITYKFSTQKMKMRNFLMIFLVPKLIFTKKKKKKKTTSNWWIFCQFFERIIDFDAIFIVPKTTSKLKSHPNTLYLLQKASQILN